jgi:hypothetical protein
LLTNKIRSEKGIVPDMRDRDQQACPRKWKKYEERVG